MAKFSAATDHALSVIAHLAMARNLSKSVKGMEGFYDFYASRLAAKDKEVLKRFDSLCRVAYIDLASMFERDLKADGQ